MEGSSTSPNNNNDIPITTNSNWQPWPEEALTMARTALDLTRQDWSLTGQTILPSPSPTSSSTTSQQQQQQQQHTNSGPPILPHNIYNHPTLADLGNKVGREEIVERMVSLLFVRIVALVTCRLGNTVPRSSTSSPNNIGGHNSWDNTESLVNNDKGEGKVTKNSLKKRRQKIYTDYSTTTICKAALQLNNPPTPPTNQQNTPQQQLTTSFMDAEHSHDEQVDGPMDKGYHSEPGTRHELNNKKIKNHRRASDNPPSPPTKNDIYGKTSGGGANEVPPSHLLFPSSITPQVIQQLRHYVTTICNQYHTPSNVPYHNVEHAYHVFLSANKLLDLMLCESPEDYITPALMMNGSSNKGGGGVGNNVNFITSQMGNMAGIVPPGVPPSSSTMAVIKRRSRRRSSVDSTTSNLSTNTRHRPTFGLKSDPLSQLAYLFSALVHDVDHTGISNRQLVLESDDLAILYNDQSVAEQRSLAVAFTTLKKNAKGEDGGGGGYKELREVLFPEQPTPESEEGAAPPSTANPAAPSGNEDFFKFRKLVIDLVLVTDIASPERTQIVKSKWKEAFGDVIVAEKLKKSATQQLQKANKGGSRGREYFRVDRNKVQTLDPTAEDEIPQVDNVGNGSSNTVTKGMLAGGPKLIPTRRKYNKGSSGSLDQEGRFKGKGKSKSGGDDPEQVQPRSTTPTTSNNQRTQYSSSLVSATDSNCDSIYFDSSDSSLSDMNSLDDDFDASAVSRTKMNFDSLDASTNSNMSDMNASDFNSSGTSGGDNINRRGSDNSGESNEGEVNQVSGGPVGTKANRSSRGRQVSQGEETTSTSTSGTSGGVDPLSKRWSTGDLTDDVDLNNNSSSPQQPKSPRGRAISSSDKVNQNYTVSARTSRPSTSKSFTIPSKTSSGSPSNSRRRKSALSRPLSQSMVSHKDLRRARPRAHSEERRLGVRRALDLAGSTIIAYNNLRGSVGSERSSLLSNSGGTASGDDCIEDEFDPDDDVDEFKATVVLEQMIRAADVAALLQDWNNTMKWSTRLYKELKNGYLQNRGEDPTVGWFENQIKFFDFYILPLAKNLGVMGVFEESVGSMFVYCVKSNLARWIEEGSRETELMIKQDADERKRSQEGQQSVNSLSQEVVSMGINEGDKVQPPPALSNGDASQPPPR